MKQSFGPLRLSVIVPTFNEAGNIDQLISRIEKVLHTGGWELIFVDDDSPDGTSNLARERAIADPRIRCVQRIGRRGLSSACVEGILASSAPAIAVMDGDLQHDESLLPDMLSALEQENIDLVIGTRYAAGGGTGDWDEQRRKLSQIATWISGKVLKQEVSDPMSGFFMISRDAMNNCVRNLSVIGYKILFDILASSPGHLNIKELPYTFRERSVGESKLDERVVWDFGMILVDKTVGRFVPVRFFAFASVGSVGVIVHMVVLASLLSLGNLEFVVSQSIATVFAMVFNFYVNNALTYRDRRLRGISWIRGLASFVMLCTIGAIANVGVATYLFEGQTQWAIAGLAGIAVGAVWNFAMTKIYTWGD